MPVVEFTVPGPPVSAQSHNKLLLQTWKNTVRTEARRVCAALNVNAPMTGSLRFVCTNYYEGPSAPLDDDNMVKPIRDALQGIVYVNDKQISDSAVRQTSIDGPVVIRGASLAIALAYCKGDEFVYVKVEPAPSHAQLLT